jgi:alkylation response protein AidB-like acyl-CoA dehydrogenase
VTVTEAETVTAASAPATVRTAEALDALLAGADGSGELSAAADEAERFPAELCDLLDRAGLPAYYVPTEWGGALDDHEHLLGLWRTVARHDLSAVVAHGKTYLGAASIWIAARPSQAADTAAAVLAGVPVAWGLSEPEHGADLRNGSLTATTADGGYRLDGVKWPVNNATRASRLTLLARTGAPGSPRGHSLFAVDKTALAPGALRDLPKATTHGIRGIDISGIEFDGACIPASALIGAEGAGIETVLRALQLTRTMCAALSLGAGEHALRVAARFAATREIKRRPLLERSYPSSTLARCAALLAAVEAAALVGVRSAHSLTDELSVISAIVKALAPSVTDSVIGELAEVLGVRSYLVGVHEHGAFQKLWRDHQVAAVFDGSTPVNRAALALQFPRLVRGHVRQSADSAGLAEAVAVGVRPRPLDRSALALSSRRGCSVVQALSSVPLDDAPDGLAEHAANLRAALGRITALMADVQPAALPPMAVYELAAAYELCYAGAACLHLWAAEAGRHVGEPLWEDGLWVRAALRALTARIAGILRVARPDAVLGDDTIDLRLAGLVADAALNGLPVTPFGIGQSYGH